jgi:prophage regulatory protein
MTDNNLNNRITEHKLIRIKDVIKLTSLSKSYIYQLSKENKFPKSVQIIAGGTAVAWVDSEIYNWINQRIAERGGVQL